MRRLLLRLLRRRRLEEDLEQELALHRELAGAQGNHIPLGSVVRIKEEARDLWRFGLLEDTWRDLRYAARSLVRQPGFTIFALVALVLGIGLNVAVFTYFNAMALRPWPVRDSGRVVVSLRDTFSQAEYRQIGGHARSFDALTFTVSAGPSVVVEGVSSPSRRVELVGANYFDVLGVPMSLGRGFGAWEGRAEAPHPVAVLAHAFWRSRFGADPAALGRQVRLNGVPFTVIGVTPPGFRVTFDRDIWVPAASAALLSGGEVGDPRCCELVARLAEGVSRTQAQAELDALLHRIRGDAGSSESPARVRLVGTTLIENAGPGIVMPFLLAQVAVGSIFLLACANVANLMLARALARDRELAVRLSLGASRSRVVRQLLAETLLLSAVACAAIVLPGTLRPTIASLRGMPFVNTAIDVRVLAYATAAALLAMAVCGLAPALQVTRAGLMDAMKRQSGQATPNLPLRGLLLGAQVAISVTVLVCAALLVRGVQRGSSVDVGFRSDGISAVWVQVHWKGFIERGMGDFVDRLREALTPLGPVAVTSVAPLRPLDAVTATFPGRRANGGEQPARIQQAFVDAAYFDILGIPLVAGRSFVPQDDQRDVVLVNQAMAQRYWPGQNVLGRAIRLPAAASGFPLVNPGNREEDYQVVGVVRDAHLSGISEVAPTVFRVHRGTDQAVTLLVPGRMAQAAGTLARQMDPQVSVDVTDLSSQLRTELIGARLLARIATGLGVLALVLASTGVYGVVAYAVEARRREIGIRMALGAGTGVVIRVMMERNARPLAAGLIAGLALSMLASSFLVSQLYGVSRLDPLAYGGVLLVLLAAALAASALPARRAARIDPIEVLHAD